MLLTIADFTYFQALHCDEALLSVLIALRRCSVIVSFAAGGWMFGELNLYGKGLALAGVMTGVFLIIFSS